MRYLVLYSLFGFSFSNSFADKVQIIHDAHSRLGLHFERQYNYFEAITEYRRSIYTREKKSIARDTNSIAGLNLKVAELYFASENFDKARQFYFKAHSTLNSNQKIKLQLRMMQIAYEGGNDITAYSSFFYETSYADDMSLNLAKWAFKKNQLNKAKALLQPIHEKEAHSVLFENISTYENFSFLPLALNIIPGSTLLYLGNYSAAGLSFVTVSALGVAAAVSLHAGLVVSTMVFTALALRFYWASWLKSYQELSHRHENIRKKGLQIHGDGIDFSGGVEFNFHFKSN